MTTKIAWAPGKLYKPEKISTVGKTSESDEASRRYAALSAGFVSDCPGLRYAQALLESLK